MHTTILGCGIFGSVSGSSAATCATISKVALPELLRRGYDEKIALGSLATAGTLGILIPPSITMVVYAVAADASIIRIFLAGFLPGFLLMGLFSRLHRLVGAPPPVEDAAARRADELHRQDQGVRQPDPVRGADRLHRLGRSSPATPPRPSARPTACSARSAWPRWGRMLTWKNFWEGLMGTTRTSCMIMFILAGASFLTKTMALHRHPARARRVGRQHAPLARTR